MQIVSTKEKIVQIPVFLNCEIKNFLNAYVFWINGPFWTNRIIIKKTLFLELQNNYIINKKALPNVISTFYNLNLKHINKKKKITQSFLKNKFKQQIISAFVGYKKYLRIRGVGYKFSILNQLMLIQVGFSHLLKTVIPSEFNYKFNKKFTFLRLKSNNINILTKFLSVLRNLYKPDVYKGKGIRYRFDTVKRKEGKKKTF